MAGHNRHLRGELKEIEGQVRGNVVVEPGDLMIHLDGSREVFPFAGQPGTGGSSLAHPAINHQTWLNFAGVALQGSKSGTTENIRVATAGIFKYPLSATANVTAGYKVSATSAPKDQEVINFTTSAGSSMALGVITKSQAGASNVEFRIVTRIGGVTRLGNASLT